MYAPLNIFCAATVGSFGRGQAHTVQWAASVTKTVAQSQAGRLRSARVVRHWFNDTRPGRPTQSYAGMAG